MSWFKRKSSEQPASDYDMPQASYPEMPEPEEDIFARLHFSTDAALAARRRGDIRSQVLHEHCADEERKRIQEETGRLVVIDDKNKKALRYKFFR